MDRRYKPGNLKPNFKHGFSYHPLYQILKGMKRRCYNLNSIESENYGNRGIIVCEKWRKDKKSFFEWALCHGWKKGLRLDRRDNDGNYTPENCRFVDAGLSNRNTRLLKSTNKSGYRGVYFNKYAKKYHARIRISSKSKHLGYFEDPMQAAIAYDSMAVVLDDGRPTNFRWPI